MKHGTALETAWPTAIGTMIGVEFMLTALLLWGPGDVDSTAVAALTEAGRGLFKPEYDLPIYLTGCAVTCCLVAGLALLQRRRQASSGTPRADAHPRPVVAESGEASDPETGIRPSACAADRSWSSLVLCALLFFVQLELLLVVQHLLITSRRSLLPAAAVLLLVSPLLSLGVVIFGWLPSRSRCPSWMQRRSGDVPSLVRNESSRWVDLAVTLTVVAIIYVPDYSGLAGRLFARERLHHWDFYAMAPTLAFHHGKALGTEIYSQYGIGCVSVIPCPDQH